MNFFNLEGEYIQQVCDLYPAVMDYEISIEDRKATIAAAKDSMGPIDIVNNTVDFRGGRASNEKIPVTIDIMTEYLANVCSSHVDFMSPL